MKYERELQNASGINALERDVKGALLVTLKTCCDCPSGLTCQTRGGPDVSVVAKIDSIDLNVFKGFFICPRPLGLMSRPLVSVKAKHDFLWQSPQVPLRVKIDTLVSIASKACDMYDCGVGVPGQDRGYNLRKVMIAMRAAQKEYWETGWVGNSHRNVDIGGKTWFLRGDGRQHYPHNRNVDRTGLKGCVSHAYRALCYTLTTVKKRLGTKSRKARWENYWSFVGDCGIAGVRLVQVLTGSGASNDLLFDGFETPEEYLKRINQKHARSYGGGPFIKYNDELQNQVDCLVKGYREYGETRSE
jgi:hypothetical protein